LVFSARLQYEPGYDAALRHIGVSLATPARGHHRGGCITKPVRSMRRYPLLDQPVPNGPQSVKNIKGGNLLWIWQNTL
jgi:hypothetical protein